ncbi:MAG TPA: GTPase [archaeon]|nr:GTPase [archaeon]
MPANLTPQYLVAEKAFQEARTTEEKIRCLEEMLRLIPKHKGTDHLQGDLKRKLSKLRQKSREESTKPRKSFSFKVRKEGAGQVALAGVPNTGKSSLVNALTNAEPEVGIYPYTTRVPQAAMMPYKDLKIQLIDLPPISEEHEEHWVIDLLKAADAVLLVVDMKADPLSQLEFTCRHLQEKRLWPKSAQNLPEDKRPVAAVFRPMLIVCNKVDSAGEKEDFELFHQLCEADYPIIAVSAQTGRGMEELRQALFEILGIIRVYSKTPGHKADLDEPYVLPKGSTVMDFAETVHREFAERMKFARIWSENKYDGQMVNREEPLSDGDILELHQ